MEFDMKQIILIIVLLIFMPLIIFADTTEDNIDERGLRINKQETIERSIAEGKSKQDFRPEYALDADAFDGDRRPIRHRY